MRANAPFLLVLAGTPGLPAHLSTMNASFWSRLGKGRLGIGLLSDAAARAALVEPLAAHGVGIDAGALDASWSAASVIRTSSNSGARRCGTGAWPPAQPG